MEHKKNNITKKIEYTRETEYHRTDFWFKSFEPFTIDKKKIMV